MVISIAVHAGAGNRVADVAADKRVKKLLRDAMRVGMEILLTSGQGARAAAAAVAHLERDAMTNAGRGSALTWDGAAECDAMVIDWKGDYGAVGCCRDIRAPILAAERIYNGSVGWVPQSAGLARPGLLCGAGAAMFCSGDDGGGGGAASGRAEVQKWLVTAHAREKHERYKAAVTERMEGMEMGGSGDVTDTVGAACVDELGTLSAACSSGGAWLKPRGRVGGAAIPGAGAYCTAQRAALGSGVGEEMIRTALSASAARGEDGPLQALQGGNAAGRDVVGGVVTLTRDGGWEWAHTAGSFAVGHWAAGAPRGATAIVSRGAASEGGSAATF